MSCVTLSKDGMLRVQRSSTGEELVEKFNALVNRLDKLESQLTENMILSISKDELKSLIKEVLKQSEIKDE
jgi:hypothetical protein